MKFPALQTERQSGASASKFFIAMLFLTIPFSTALMKVSFFFACAASLYETRGYFGKILSLPAVYYFLIFYFYLIASAVWVSSIDIFYLEGLLKYSKFLALPLLACGVYRSNEGIDYYFKFFVIGCLIASIVILMSRFGVLESLLGPAEPQVGWRLIVLNETIFRVGPPESPVFGRNYITQGFFLTCALSIVALSFHGQRTVGTRLTLVGVGVVVFLAIATLRGRTAPILLVVLVVGIVFIYLKQKKGFGALALSSLFLFSALAAYYLVAGIGNLEYLVEDTLRGFADVQKLTSVGMRLNFLNVALSAFLANPFLGNGLGSFTLVFKNINKSENIEYLSNTIHPHSELALIAVQGGLVLMVIWGLCLSAVWKLSVCRVKFLLFLFGVNSIFASVIWDAGEGTLLTSFVALSVGTHMQKRVES